MDSSQDILLKIKNSIPNIDEHTESLLNDYAKAHHMECMLGYINGEAKVIEEFLIDEAINDTILIANLNEEEVARELLKTQFVIINKQDIIKSE